MADSDETPRAVDIISDMDVILNEPLRPAKEYEEIIIREVSIGFSGGVQDLTLYPEDEMVSDDHGNIRILYHTLKERDESVPEFVAYAGHTQWHSIREVRHKRERGILRPDPKKIMDEVREQRIQERKAKMRAIYEEVRSLEQAE